MTKIEIAVLEIVIRGGFGDEGKGETLTGNLIRSSVYHTVFVQENSVPQFSK